MRSIYEIQKDIAVASHRLNSLILEKKLTLQVMWGIEEQAKVETEKLMTKLKHVEDCGK